MLFQKPKYYKDCSELRAATFFKILKTQDKNLLCYYGKPKQKEVEEIWSAIELEYETLTGNPKYFHQLAEANRDCEDIIRNNGLILLYWKKKLAPDKDWSEDEIFWDVEGLDADAIYTTILRERTKYKIRKLQEEERNNLKEGNHKPLTIERLKHIVQIGLDVRNINLEEISVIEWIDYVHMLEEKTDAITNKS